jgi:transposase
MLKMVLQYPTWTKLRVESEENLINFLIANKYRTGKYIERTLKKIKDYEHIISLEVETGLSYEAICIAQILLMLKSQIEKLEEAMAKITNAHSMGKIFKTLPGAGEMMAGKILCLIGDNKKRFTNANQAQCLFGTAPMNYQSGGYHKVIMRKACNKRGKGIMYTFAFSSLQHSNWAREYYDKQRKLGKTHSIAIRALSNKWLKVIFLMWLNEDNYDEKMKKPIAA